MENTGSFWLWWQQHISKNVGTGAMKGWKKKNWHKSKIKGQNWMCVIFGPLGGTKINQKRPDSLLDITAWAQKHLQKSPSVKTAACAIHKCKFKLYHPKEKLWVNTIQKSCCLLWAKAHLKWCDSKWKTARWADKLKSEILFGNHGWRDLWDHPACYQFKSLHLWCLGLPMPSGKAPSML